jgi:hypothetical protein
LAAALIVLLPACLFSGPEKGVSVKALSADLVFGVPPLPEPVGAPNTPVPDDFIPVISNGFSLPPPPPPPTKERCPEADPTDFPDAAPSTITTRPKAGSYEWVVGGYQMVNNTRAGFPTFHNRQVFGVEGTSTGAEGVDTFNFTVREPELTFGSSNRFEKTFEVRSDGLYLIQLTRVDGEGNRVSFNPSPAIQYLTLPVIIGDDIGGSGVDPTTLEAMTLEGTVMRRHRPDACGKFIDSWLVEAVEEVRTLSGTSTKRYHYSIATGLGGLIVYEHIESPVEEPELVIDARIGQLSPS